MPRITTTGYSNSDTVKEPPLFDAQGKERLPNEKHNLAHFKQYQAFPGGAPSPGTSSSTSESKPEQSGSTAPETESLTPSPAPYAENPSGPDQQPSQAPSSTASSTDGSGQGTGRSRRPRQASSGESAPATPVTPDTTEADVNRDLTPEDQENMAANGREALHMAREAFDAGDFDLAEEMLKEAETLDSSLAPEVDTARKAIKAAQP